MQRRTHGIMPAWPLTTLVVTAIYLGLAALKAATISNHENDMPLEKDGTGKRWVEMHFVTPGTAEQVWQAMATGAGNAAWFTRATIEERVGGALKFHFGPEISSAGEVTIWEPPHRFGYVEREWNEGAPPVATEIAIASRADRQCTVRMVHSLVSAKDTWDDQLENFERGWPAFFEVLRIYLANFAGMNAASFQAMTSVEGEHLAVWTGLVNKLDLSGANVGERRSITQPAQLSGIVERIQQDSKVRVITLRLDSPTPGVALIGTYGSTSNVTASVSVFFYGNEADATATANSREWQGWLRDNAGK